MRGRLTLVAAAVVLSASMASAQPQPASVVDVPADAFAQANSLYEKGEYEEAIDIYLQLERAGVQTSDLYYNLANAYYKTEALGYAILYYERARRLAPRDQDIRQNLTLAQSLIGDTQFVVRHGRIRRMLLWWHDKLSAGESFVTLSIVYLLLTASVLLFVFRRVPLVQSMYRKISLASPGRFLGLDSSQDMVLAICTFALLTGMIGLSAFSKYDAETSRTQAVVVVEEVPVYSGPSESATHQFNISQGTNARIAETRPGWIEIKLPGDLTGWIRLDAVERI